jgi:hypothetical protein
MNGMRFAALLLVLTAIAACSPDGAPRRGPMTGPDPAAPAEAIRPANRDRVQLTGTIHHVAAEGGVYVIRTSDGQQYRLVELPRKFQEEGLGVVVDGLRHDDVLTKDMAGQAIDILEIRVAAEAR